MAWLSKGLKKSSKTKQRLYLTFLKNKSLQFEEKYNKNILTALANCKKTTKFWRFRGQISPNTNFVWKIGFIQIEGHI